MTNRLHYAWIVALVTFGVLLVTAGIRATPGVLMISLEGEFGWSRAVVSGAGAINIALFGLIGPFAASVMDRWGLRRVVHRRAFCILAGTFFVCGASTNGLICGWIGASHQLGASMAAFGAGTIRTMLGDYQLAFWTAGVLCVLAGLSFRTIGRRTFVPPCWTVDPSTPSVAPAAVSG